MNVVQAVETGGPGGAENVLINLSEQLVARGHRVRVILIKQGWLAEQLSSRGIEVTVIPIARPLDRRFLTELTARLREFGTDILHSHEFTLGFYGRLATRKLGLPQVVTAHGRNFSRGIKRRLLAGLLLRGAARYRLVAVSRDLAVDLARGLRIPRKRIDVVPNGVSITRAARSPEARPRGTLRLIAVGNLYPVKNHALLIRAVAELERRGVEVRLQILGRGREEASLRALADELGVAARVVLRGFELDVTAFLEDSDVFVSSSLSEGMPLSFLEAMARGLPIVASRVGGTPELVDHGKHGFLFTPGNLDELVGHLERLAADPVSVGRLGNQAAERVRAEFSTDTMVDRYQQLYGELAVRTRAPRTRE